MSRPTPSRGHVWRVIAVLKTGETFLLHRVAETSAQAQADILRIDAVKFIRDCRLVPRPSPMEAPR